MTNWLTFEPIFDSYLAVFAIAIGLILLLLLKPAFHAVSRGQRLTLIGLRLGIVLLVLIFMLRPTWKSTTKKRETKALLVFFDQSRSMQHPHGDGKTRWQAQLETLRGVQPQLQQLAGDLAVEFYAFDAEQPQLIPFEKGVIQFPSSPEGRLTDIGSTIDEIFQQHRGKRLAGIILLSDGTQTAYNSSIEPLQAAEELKRKQCPLYTVPFGRPDDAGQTGDIAVQYLPDQYSVFVKHEFLVVGSMRIRGYVNKDLPVELLVESTEGEKKPPRVVGKTVVRITDDNEHVDVSIPYTPDKAGQYKLTLRAIPQRDERVTDNNSLSAYLTVLEGGLKVLYLEGELRTEQKFLRRAIAASPDIDLDFQWIDHRTRKDWPENLTKKIRDGNYDVFVIGDLDAAALFKKKSDEETLQTLADQIEKGKGLIMLGGYHSFGPGSYRGTPLANVLPIEMGQFEKQDFDTPIAEDMHLPGPLKLKPADSHFLSTLGEKKENEKIWRSLPPLSGANRFAQVKRGGGVAVHVTTLDDKPILVSGEYGSGRVLAMAGDSTWRWSMLGHKDQHRRFWRQNILWLARRDGLAKDAVWVKLTQRRFTPGSPVEFTTGVKNLAGEVVRDATITAHVVTPDGKRQVVNLSTGDDHATGTFKATKLPGDYSIEISAQRGDEPPVTAKTNFLIFDQDPELSNTSANPGQLARLANQTKEVGGKLVPPENIAELLKEIKTQPHHIEQEIQRKWQPSMTTLDSWIFFLCFVLLLTTEWVLRKKWGLV